MAPRSHVHKYILRNIGKRDKPRKVYACALPDCTHFMPHKALVLGKKSICWQCEEEFIITSDIVGKKDGSRREKIKLRCPSCRGKVKLEKVPLTVKKEEEVLDDAIGNMLGRLKGDL